MKKEIGSFYEAYEPTETSAVLPADRWWDIPGLQLVCSGREAIEGALIDIEKKHPQINKICVLPQYTCDTVILPFQKHGWKIAYYQVDRTLMVNEKELEALLQIKPGVLFMHTYYGVDTIRPVRPLIAEHRKNNGLLFIEDMTQSLGLWKTGQDADYYVGSLRKWCPIPDGGFLYSKRGLELEVAGEKTTFIAKKTTAQKMKLDYLHGRGTVIKQKFLQMNSEAEEYLYQNSQVCRISTYSMELLSTIDITGILRRRRENAEYLAALISQSGKFQICTCGLESAPLYLPIYVENRTQLQDWLRRADVFAPVLWPVPAIVDGIMSENTHFIFHHLLALPCDQRYDRSDMNYVFDILCNFCTV